MRGNRVPVFSELDEGEVHQVLERNSVGRVAFCRNNRVEIVPVHYVYSPDWIYGRTAPGSQIDRLGEHWWPVAFEVDEVEGLFDWRSAVVHGGLYVISPDRASWERNAWMTAMGMIRKLVPEALREDDPVPFRSRLFRIAVQQVSGRRAGTGPSEPPPETGE